MESSVKRVTQIISIMAKYGFGELLSGSKFEEVVRKATKKKEIEELDQYQRIRLMLEECGTTFIKLGQILSQRSDLIPKEMTDELTKLQDSIKPVEIDIDEVLKESFGQTSNAYFEKINQKPIGVASIGQVYSATLKTGEKVVLKIRKPGVEYTVNQDLKILNDILKVLLKNPKIREYKPGELFESFRSTLLKELDYGQEVKNILRFFGSYHESETIYVPKVYTEVCGQNIICMELIDGIKIDKRDKISAIKPNTEELSKIICDYYFDQILEKGFYHADPHPGNVYLMQDGKICLLDYGMTGSLLEEDRLMIGDFFYQMIKCNAKGLIDILEEITPISKDADLKSLEYEIDDLLQDISGTIDSINTELLLQKLIDLLSKYKIYFPGYFYNLLRTVGLLDGLLRDLSPEINMMEFIQPYARSIMMEKANPKRLLNRLFTSVVGFERSLLKMPALINKMVSKAMQNELKVGIETKGLDESVSKLERISRNLVLAILVGSLLIASSLVVLAKTPPFLWGIPMLGAIGYLISLVLALYIIVKLSR